MKKYLGPILTYGVLALFAGYFYFNRSDFTPLLHVSFWALVTVGLLKILVSLTNGTFMKISVEAFTAKMSLLEGFYVAVLSAAGNYFGPILGGASIRAVYLKRHHKLAYSKFASTLAGYYLIVFIANSLFALSTLVFIAHNNPHLAGSMFALFGGWLVALIVLAVVRFPKKLLTSGLAGRRIIGGLIRSLYDVESGWGIIKRQPKLLTKLTLLAIATLGITFLTAWVEFAAIHVHLPLAAMGFYAALSSVSLLISITPGAIGIRESILIVNASLLGITSTQILQVAVIDRGVNFLVLGGLLFTVRLLKTRFTQKTA